MRRTKEEAAQTRQQLLNAALSIFSRQSFDATTLEEVAEAAGVTRGAIYHHFGSKADLFQALIEEASTQGGEVVQQAISGGGSFTDITRRVLEHTLTLLEENRRFRETMALSLFRSGSSPELEALAQMRYEQAITQVTQLAGFFQAGIDQGALRPDLDPFTAARGFLAYQNGLAMLWLSNRDAFSIKDQASQFADLFMKGVEAG